MTAQVARLPNPHDLVPFRAPPVNHEAEIQLLGTILANNRAYGQVAGFLKAEHFADDRHAKIYAAVSKVMDDGQQATAVTLKAFFDRGDDPDAAGGPAYLFRLSKAAVTAIYAQQHGRLILDCYLKRRAMEILDAGLARLSDPDEGADANQILLDTISETESLTAQGVSQVQSAREVRESIVADMGREVPCYSTGFRCIDIAMGGGLFAEKAYGIAARKKMGKTMLAGQISRALNHAGVPHLYLAGEMGPKQIEQRNMAMEMGINSLAFLGRRPRPEFITRAGDHAVSAPEHQGYVDAAGLTFERLRREVIHAALTRKIKGFILDYVQLVGGQPRGKSRAEHLEDICQWIADTCRKRKLFAIVLAQINQEGNVRHGEGLRLAFDQVYELKRDQGGDGLGAWLEMMDTRYTRWTPVGDETKPALFLNTSIGPHFEEPAGE